MKEVALSIACSGKLPVSQQKRQTPQHRILKRAVELGYFEGKRKRLYFDTEGEADDAIDKFNKDTKRHLAQGEPACQSRTGCESRPSLCRLVTQKSPLHCRARGRRWRKCGCLRRKIVRPSRPPCPPSFTGSRPVPLAAFSGLDPSERCSSESILACRFRRRPAASFHFPHPAGSGNRSRGVAPQRHHARRNFPLCSKITVSR